MKPAFPEYTPTLPKMIRHLAERFGDRDMIVLGERRLTYRQAERESAKLARGLLASGVGKGTRVALLMPNGPDWALAWLATCRIGALCVPLTTFLRERELVWNLRHADVHTLLTCDRYLNHDYLERLERAVPELSECSRDPLFLRALPYLRSVRVWGAHDRDWASDGPSGLAVLADAASEIDEDFLSEIEREVTPADPMLIMYTSGSTAEPKGACHTHGTAVRHSHVLNAYRRGGPDHHVYSAMPFFWVGGLSGTLMGTMHAGGCFFCEESFDVDDIIDLIERERISYVAGWPHQSKAISEHPRYPKNGFDFIRYGSFTMLPSAIRPAAFDLLPNALGMTETFANHSMEAIGVVLPEHKRGSFGHALEAIQRRIVDPDTGEEVPPGEWGDLCIRGYSLMQGLYKLEREQVFTPDGFYRTSDECRVEPDPDSDDNGQGHLYLKGRLGEMIKTSGANVAPREVELVLESFDEIKEAFVVGVADPERSQVVAAAVVPYAGQTLGEAEIRERLRAELSTFKVPRHIFILTSDQVPRTASAKIQKPILREILTERIAAAREEPTT
ncbi:acyl--CoA ligase [Myxococcota bacterium]|nr:acyl--CoA ligase [Myxococcota bacterium]